jgi:hypothetical protein
MIKLYDLLFELEFTSQKEFDDYSKSHKIRPSTKVTIAGVQTTAGKASLRRGLPDKPYVNIFNREADKKTPNEKSIKEYSEEELQKINTSLYDVISDWVISSLDNTENRQNLLKKLDGIEIPAEYKEVPSEYLYRAKSKNTNSSTQKYVSYSYDISGAEKMKEWIKKIFGKSEDELEIIKKPANDVNILISIPSFLKYYKKSSGKEFDKLWKTEKEVIVKND